MITTMIIGNRIAEARKKLNISQSQLAEKLFISSQAVGKWERGESMPDIVTFNRIAEILGVDLNYFSENFKSVAAETEPQVKEPPAGKQKKKSGWDMSGGNWVDADFSGMKNLNEKFSTSNMQRCLFKGSDLSGLTLSCNNISGCDFSGSALGNSIIKLSSLSGNNFKESSLNDAEFSGTHVSGCDFTKSDFTGTEFKMGAFVNNKVAGATWNRTSFSGMQLTDILFDGTIEECSFENSSFSRVTFQNATFINTFFKNRSLKKIRFIDCKADRMTYEFLKNGKAEMGGVRMITNG